MARPFLDDRGKETLRGAARAVEERSAAEVVILVRERSGPYLHASLLAGAIAGYFTLDPAVVASAIAALGGLLQPVLPRDAEDVNELPDDIGA